MLISASLSPPFRTLPRARSRGGYSANCSARHDRAALALVLPHSRVDLAMAIRARHHTLEQLVRDCFPRAGRAISRDAEIPFASIPMVEFEKRIGNNARTAAAPDRP
jgi:hypothetical protein